MMRSRSRRGVTLIEMLIAISLVSLLSTGILYAMSLGLSSLERTNRRFTDNRRVLGSMRVIEQQLAGIIPAQVPCFGRGTGGFAPLFFQGESGSLQFVSSYTLEEAARGYPRVVEYMVLAGERGIGGVRLVMQERPYNGPSSVTPLCVSVGSDPVHRTPTAMLRPPQLATGAFVLADRLAYCRISYQRVHPITFVRSWEPAYSGAALPGAIRIEMAPLQPDPARVQLSTTTIPLRVSRNTYEAYADIEQQ